MNENEWKARWEERYSEDTFAYGESPNTFFAAQLNGAPGSILLPAEGEGRNAVYAAMKGWRATAFDISEAGRRKALLLAEKHRVSIEYLIGSPEALRFEQNAFDAIALIYAHFPAAKKADYHQTVKRWLKPGGQIIFEAFSKEHLKQQEENPAVGGPKDEASLFSIEEIRNDFSGYEMLLLEEKIIELHEGKYHNGKGSVIRCVARKPL